jgi:hypothetical protein
VSWRLLIATAVASLALVSCGGDDDPFDAYCQEVEDQQAALSEDLATDSATALIDALPEFEALRAKSPDDLRDEWTTVTERIRALADALDDAGVDPATYDREHPPAGVSKSERRAIKDAATALATPEMAAALDGVEQQARDVCRTPLVL